MLNLRVTCSVHRIQNLFLWCWNCTWLKVDQQTNIFLNRFLHLIKSNRKPQLKIDPLNKRCLAFMLVMFTLLENVLLSQIMKIWNANITLIVIHDVCKKKKKIGQNQRNNEFYYWTREWKFHCVFFIIGHCCKINGFDKTSQSLSLCSPVEMLTLLGTVITASVSTLWQQEELVFPEKEKRKEKLVTEKTKTGFRKTEKQSWFALLHFSKSNDHYLYAGLEKLDFHTSGILNLSSITNGF